MYLNFNKHNLNTPTNYFYSYRIYNAFKIVQVTFANNTADI